MTRFFTGALAGMVLIITLISCGSSRSARKSDTIKTTVSGDKTFAQTYSQQLGITVPQTSNQLLITTIADWIGVPYRYGGMDKKGVDCSGFISNVYPQVYNLNVPRVAAQMHAQSSKVALAQLREGDLVFFKIQTKEVGHAGIYLFDNYFVHASTSKGVMISRLNDTYWQKYFVGGGRFTR